MMELPFPASQKLYLQHVDPQARSRAYGCGAESDHCGLATDCTSSSHARGCLVVGDDAWG